nr:hypothetical protein [Tanacetum cinerariifolium]
MSDNIPFDIQMDIINRLPVKSLLEFRTVSKQWKFSIENFEFIRNYGVRKRSSCCFNLSYKHDTHGFMYSIDENLAFRHMDSNLNVFSLTPVASSEGVWCFAFGENLMLLLWNPSIKKSVGILVPNYTYQPDSPKMIFGFGILPVTLELTLLKINFSLYNDSPWYVSVSTLSSRTWYNLDYDCLPRQSIRIKRAGQAVIDGKIFWIGSEKFYNDDGSFDFGDCRIIYAWALEVEGGFVSSCRLLFTIPHPAVHYLKLLGFNKDNQLIMEATIVQQKLSVLKLAESYHEMVQEWYFKCRELADNMTSEITKWVANKGNGLGKKHSKMVKMAGKTVVDCLTVGERKPRKGQNQIKTRQKREACRSREKFKAVAVNKERKTEQNTKRMAKNANAVKSYSSLKRMKKRRGLEVKIQESSTTRAISAYFLKLWCTGTMDAIALNTMEGYSC